MKRLIDMARLLLALALLLGTAIADDCLLELSLGSRPGQLPGPGENARRADGMAAAVQRHPDGGWLLLVPETGRLERFAETGEYLGAIVPRHPNRPLTRKNDLIDFDVAPDGTLYLLDRGAGTAWRCRPDGTITSNFGLFLHPQRIDLQGEEVCVVDQGAGTVSAFDLEGTLRWQRKGWRWSSILTKNSEFVGFLLRKDRLLLLRAEATTLPPSQRGLEDPEGIEPRRARLFAVHRCSTEGQVINEAHVLGRDAAGRIYVMCEEGAPSHSKIFRLLRYSAGGRLEAQRALPKWADWLHDRPRPMRVTAAGEVLGMRWNDTGWKLLRYELSDRGEGNEK